LIKTNISCSVENGVKMNDTNDGEDDEWKRESVYDRGEGEIYRKARRAKWGK
jgi:hypothetical protein